MGRFSKYVDRRMRTVRLHERDKTRSCLCVDCTWHREQCAAAKARPYSGPKPPKHSIQTLWRKGIGKKPTEPISDKKNQRASGQSSPSSPSSQTNPKTRSSIKQLEQDTVIKTREWRDSYGTPHKEYHVIEEVVIAHLRKDGAARPKRKAGKSNTGTFSKTNQPKQHHMTDCPEGTVESAKDVSRCIDTEIATVPPDILDGACGHLPSKPPDICRTVPPDIVSVKGVDFRVLTLDGTTDSTASLRSDASASPSLGRVVNLKKEQNHSLRSSSASPLGPKTNQEQPQPQELYGYLLDSDGSLVFRQK
jgi:hypothetical protein